MGGGEGWNGSSARAKLGGGKGGRDSQATASLPPFSLKTCISENASTGLSSPIVGQDAHVGVRGFPLPLKKLTISAHKHTPLLDLNTHFGAAALVGEREG